MKHFHIYLFTKEGCPPCDRVKEHIQTLTDNERSEIDVVPILSTSGKRTALAEEFSIELTPTLVVTHINNECEIDWNSDEEFCEQKEETVERFVGGDAVIKNLPSTIDSYTYAHTE